MSSKGLTMAELAGCRKSCGKVLARNNNRLKLMFGILVCASSMIFYYSVHSLFRYGIFPIPAVSGNPANLFLAKVDQWVAFWALTQFLAVPLLFGLFYMAAQMEKGNDVTLEDLFYGFSSFKRYGRSMRLGMGVSWRVGLLIVFLCIINRLFFTLWNGAERLGIAVLGALAMISIFYLWLILFAGDFQGFFRRIQPEGFRMPRGAMRRTMLKQLADFLPWLLLSLLSVGILALAEVFPKYLLAYSRCCRVLYEENVHEEETF